MFTPVPTNNLFGINSCPACPPPLQHISAPLMEFERQNLIKEFTMVPPVTAPVEGEEPIEETTPPEDGEAPLVFVDYRWELVDIITMLLYTGY